MLQTNSKTTEVRPRPRIVLPEMTQLQRDAAKRLVHQWAEDESGYDERVWPIIKASIEENRLSERERFVD